MTPRRSPGAHVTVRRGVGADAHSVATLHADLVADGFLATLGPRFLGRLYRRMLRSSRAFVIVGDSDGAVCGFVAVAEDTRAFYRDFLVRDGVLAGLVALPRVLGAPRHVWETFRYGTAAAEAALPRAEILAVAVAPSAQGHGLAVRLVTEALAELGRRGVPSARVVTAMDNEPARRTYERAGFERRERIEVHHGVAQDVLVWP